MILARFLCLILTLLASVGAMRADTLRVMTYNALNFRGEQDANRIQDFRMIINHTNPDVVAMQEIITEDAVDYLLSFAFLPCETDWAAAPFTNHNGSDTDNALFFRTSKAQLVSQWNFDTDPRDVDVYVLQPVSPDTAQRIRIYSCHLKAGNSSSDANRRAGAAEDIREYLDLLPPGELFFLVGDFNLYTAAEEAYGIMLSPSPEPNGQLFDPIDEFGDWHASPTFAEIHTQSPRGGSGGGMDDRFDFLLASSGLMDTSGTYVIPETYYAVGNDGQHLNESINEGTNFAVPDSVADALYDASDHVPVVVDVLLRMQGTPVSDIPVPRRLELLSCYPNPFNSTLTVQVAGLHAPSTLTVFDLLGRRVHEQSISSGTARLIRLDFSTATTGTYLIQLQSPSATEIQTVFQIR